MSELVPLRNLVTALQAAMDGGKSGAFFITTDDQHSAMITLSAGSITGMKFRSARGYDAASSLAHIEQIKYRAAAEPTELPGESDLNSRTVLEILGTGDAGSVAASGVGAAGNIDLEAMRSRYIAAIGPIAATLFDETVADMKDALDTAEGRARLIERLAEQIDDENETVAFLRAIRADE